jgi:hypothetical protein
MHDLVNLIDVVPPFEQRLASQELRQNASDRPYVYCGRLINEVIISICL